MSAGRVCVCVSGHQTKALLNNSGPRAKRSKLERDINVDILSQGFILLTLSVLGAIGQPLLRSYVSHSSCREVLGHA